MESNIDPKVKEIVDAEIKNNFVNYMNNITTEEINKIIDNYYREIDIKQNKELRLKKLINIDDIKESESRK